MTNFKYPEPQLDEIVNGNDVAVDGERASQEDEPTAVATLAKRTSDMTPTGGRRVEQKRNVEGKIFECVGYKVYVCVRGQRLLHVLSIDQVRVCLEL